MNIAYFNWFGLMHTGGIEVYLNKLISELYKMGHYAILYSGDESAIPYCKKTEILNRNVNKLSTKSIEKWVIDNKSELSKYEIFHFHNPHIYQNQNITNLVLILKKHFPNAVCVASLHNVPKNIESDSNIIDLFCGNLITCSEFFRLAINQVYNCDSVILQYCIDLPDRAVKPKISHNKKKVYLQPTRFANWKGSHHSLNAFVNLYRNGFKDFAFIHAGITIQKLSDNWDSRWEHQYPGLLNATHELVKKGNISFVEYEYKDCYKYLTNADIILHPTSGTGVHGDPNPTSVLQSVLMNKPIITTGSGNIPNILSGYNKAYICKADDGEELCRTVHELHIDTDELVNVDNEVLINKLRQNILNSPSKHIDYYKSKII